MRVSFWSDGERRFSELLIAARFFTRLPLAGGGVAPEAGDLAAASWAMPVVGVFVGLVCGVAYAIAAALHFPPLAASLIAVGAGALATGALHEDGLADTADGLGGGSYPAEKLAIMRDSRSGAFAIVALVIVVGLRVAAVAALPGAGAALAAFVAAHAVGRGGLPAVMYFVPSARSEGLGAMAGRPDTNGVFWSLGIASVLTLLLLGPVAGIAALILAGLVRAAIAALAWHQIGGHTGDVLGAIEQGGETAMLLAAASWAW
jgi:adenosylcobinamide-GDP ribazoletransferase